MKARAALLATLSAGAVVAVAACAQAAPNGPAATAPVTRSGAGPGAGQDERRGYWWKKEPPKAPDADELTAPPSTEVLLSMRPKDLSELLEKYKDYAIWKQTPESVQWYYQEQDAARLKARAFMNVTEMVMLQNPQLNMQTVYPTNPVGQAAKYKERTETLENRLHAERDRVALVMLSQPGCEYCTAQRGILKYFQDKYGWEVAEIDVTVNPDAIVRFGTNYTPTTIAIFRGRADWQPVALGVETFEKVEESTYRAVRYVNGEIGADQYTLEEQQDKGPYDPRRRSP